MDFFTKSAIYFQCQWDRGIFISKHILFTVNSQRFLCADGFNSYFYHTLCWNVKITYQHYKINYQDYYFINSHKQYLPSTYYIQGSCLLFFFPPTLGLYNEYEKLCVIHNLEYLSLKNWEFNTYFSSTVHIRKIIQGHIEGRGIGFHCSFFISTAFNHRKYRLISLPRFISSTDILNFTKTCCCEMIIIFEGTQRMVCKSLNTLGLIQVKDHTKAIWFCLLEILNVP